MKPLVAAVLVAAGALVGGAAGAALTVSMMSPERESPKLSKDTAKDRGKTDARNVPAEPAEGESVEVLQARLRSLERRVSLLTFAQQHTSPTRAVGEEDGEDGNSPTKTVDDPVFEAAVRDVLDQVEYERNADRDTRREERRTQWTERWVASLSEPLGLSDEQKQKVAGIVTEHFRAMSELGNSEERPVLRSEWRKRMSELSEKANQQLTDVLDSSQKAKYDEMDDSDKLGGRGSWGRFGGGRARGGRSEQR